MDKKKKDAKVEGREKQRPARGQEVFNEEEEQLEEELEDDGG